jgi:UDP-N-acetylmuramoyl-tripeptide--D-alanyl-D-alanine ligase
MVPGITPGITSGVAAGPPPGVLVAELLTDSRTLSRQSIFVALRGERFDGHSYLEEARAKGAIASIVSQSRLEGLPARGGPYIAVDDPLEALERIARWNRNRLNLRVVGVTGSVGKTSTKEFLATVLAGAFQVKSAPKSFNNRLGVAITLLSATPKTEILVVELGTSGLGELSHLSLLARPDRVVLTEIAPAHIAGLGDLAGVVRAKAEVFDGLDPGGAAFIRHGVHGFDSFQRRVSGRLITFGWGAGDFCVTDCQRVLLGEEPKRETFAADYGYHFTINGSENFLLPVPGRHNVLNAAAAISVARDLGMSWEEIRYSLASCRLPPLRLEVAEEHGLLFVDDSYNANPLSMEAAIDEWGSLRVNGSTSLVAVLGDMLEMGALSRRLHEDIGRKIGASGARIIVTIGRDSHWIGEACRGTDGGKGAETAHFESALEALPFLKESLRPGDRILFKASRLIGLDRLVIELRKWARENARLPGRKAGADPPSRNYS